MGLSQRSVGVAEEAGGLLAKIVPDIRRTAELVQEISASSAEQSSGATQITKAVTQLDSVIQQNASSSEQMASMAEELSGQSTRLAEVLSYFSMRKTEGAAMPGQAAATGSAAGQARRTAIVPVQKKAEGEDGSFEEF
jgi:methyl-accepting chemotaxis protein